MRVGIVTFHAANNFGAVLQSYALCRALNELGCETKVIDYRPEYLVGPHNRLGLRPWCMWNKLKRIRRFNRFRQEFLPTTNRVYIRPEELWSHPPDIDVYVCGSDQIWNLAILKGRLDPGFFLKTIPEGKRRVAYAPSFGDMPEFPVELREDAARLLGRFDALSIREESGKTLLRQLIGRDVPVVVDPSLLVEDYSEITRRPKRPPERCIVVYPLENSQRFFQCVHNVRKLLNLPVVNIGPGTMPDADFNFNCLGPGEWLGWMQTASFICTNSFHGTAYSIIFRKNFLSFPHQTRPGLNVRVETLLKLVGLSARLVASPDTLDKDSIALGDVKYESVGLLLHAAVAKSRDYLRNAILGG